MRFWAAVSGILIWSASTSLGAEPPLEVSPWDFSGTLRAGGGYKDNVLLDHNATEQNSFLYSGAELFLIRAPVDNWEFTSVASADDRRYLQNKSVDKEQMFFGLAEAKFRFFDIWKAGLEAEYFYNDQIFDASVTDQLLLRIRAQSHRSSAKPSLQLNLPGNRRFELTAPIARQQFEETLDSSWEVAPKLLFAQKYGFNSEFTLSAQFHRQIYDKRGAPNALGVGNGHSLTFERQEYEIGFKHYWDKSKNWKSRLRLGFELNEDNGSGYYDYRKYRIGKELTYSHGGFEATVTGRLMQYEFLRQQAISVLDLRRRTEATIGLRLKKTVWKGLAMILEGEYEHVLATDRVERYHALTIWGGVEWDLD